MKITFTSMNIAERKHMREKELTVHPPGKKRIVSSHLDFSLVSQSSKWFNKTIISEVDYFFEMLWF